MAIDEKMEVVEHTSVYTYLNIHNIKHRMGGRGESARMVECARWEERWGRGGEKGGKRSPSGGVEARARRSGMGVWGVTVVLPLLWGP